MLARVIFECSNKGFMDWTSDDNSWFLKWLGVSSDITMLRTFFSVKTPTVCALYEHLCEEVRHLKRPAAARVLFEVRDTVRKNYAIVKGEAFFLRTAVEIGSRADGMLHCATRACERVLSPLKKASLRSSQHLQSLFMIAAAQRDVPMLRLLVSAVSDSDDKTEFESDAASRLLAVIMRQIYVWDLEESEGDSTIVDYIGLLIQGGILSIRLSAWCCCDDRPQLPIKNCESLTVDELVMICPPARRKHLYSVILHWSTEHRLFISKGGIFSASLDGANGLSSYLRSCQEKQSFDVHSIIQECLVFSSKLNDTDTASALLGLGTNPGTNFPSNNPEQYHKGVLFWDPIIVAAAAAGNLDILKLLTKRVDLVFFVQRVPIYGIVQVEDARRRYGVSTGGALPRLENLQRHCLYSRTEISDTAMSNGTLRFDPFNASDLYFIAGSDDYRDLFVPEQRCIDTLAWIRDIAISLGIGQTIDQEIIMAALINGPAPPATQFWTTTYHPCDVLLLEGLVDANIEYHEDDMDLLQLSIRAQCSLKVVEFLLSKGLRVHSRAAAQSGNTMLHDALLSKSSDRVQIVKLLLREGADYKYYGEGLTFLEASLWELKTTIHERRDSLELFTYLFEMGSPLRVWTRQRIQPALLRRLMDTNADDELILRVLDAGAELNTIESISYPLESATKTPLEAAICEHRERLAQEFIRRGADVHALTNGIWAGQTALQSACQAKSSLQFIRYLVEEQGANVNESPGRVEGFTALQHAAFQGTLSVAEFLLAHGSDINALSGKFKRPWKLPRFRALDFAAHGGRLDMVEFLLKAGGRSVTAGLGGAMQLAKENGHFAIFSVLQDWEEEHGSKIIMEEAEWQRQNPDSARVLLETLSKDDFSEDSTFESGDSLERVLDE